MSQFCPAVSVPHPICHVPSPPSPSVARGAPFTHGAVGGRGCRKTFAVARGGHTHRTMECLYCIGLSPRGSSRLHIRDPGVGRLIVTCSMCTAPPVLDLLPPALSALEPTVAAGLGNTVQPNHLAPAQARL